MNRHSNGKKLPLFKRIKEFILGRPHDPTDPNLFHKLSLIALFAWVGLGADGLSSSSYGPDEAFRALGQHTYLAVFLALATALTVFIISYAYSRIIEHFPTGGGGYVVATTLLGPGFGLISGSALIIDYVLTISVSIAASFDQIFSFLPLSWHTWKLVLEISALIILVLLNIRGIKESINVLFPIFLLFLVTHIVVLGYGIWSHVHSIPIVAAQVTNGISSGMSTLGFGALFLIFANAYSRGAGTYTGIEAVSNGLQIMREPKVKTAKKTMLYMALSLAITAGGILLLYLLMGVHAQEGKTMNAVMIENLGIGMWFVVLTLFAEAALLFVAAQTGFIDGPRVMSNMAMDGWFPRRFVSLSDRLTMHYGVVLMAFASIGILIYTKGNIGVLVTMYAINVFITFSLTELGMCKFWITERRKHPEWKRALPIHAIGLTLCSLILTMVVKEKFLEGGWVTLLVTSTLIIMCILIKGHYNRAKEITQKLDYLVPIAKSRSSGCFLKVCENEDRNEEYFDPYAKTAIFFVKGFDGVGLKALSNIFSYFGNSFKNFVFIEVGIVEASVFKYSDGIERLERETKEDVQNYVKFVNKYGYYGEGVTPLGTDIVDEVVKITPQILARFPNSVFFAGQIVFPKRSLLSRALHNYTVFTLQEILYKKSVPFIVLPVRV